MVFQFWIADFFSPSQLPTLSPSFLCHLPICPFMLRLDHREVGAGMEVIQQLHVAGRGPPGPHAPPCRRLAAADRRGPPSFIQSWRPAGRGSKCRCPRTIRARGPSGRLNFLLAGAKAVKGKPGAAGVKNLLFGPLPTCFGAFSLSPTSGISFRRTGE